MFSYAYSVTAWGKRVDFEFVSLQSLFSRSFEKIYEEVYFLVCILPTSSILVQGFFEGRCFIL
jgi:hypothetical protein